MKRKSFKQIRRDNFLKAREEAILKIVDPEMVPIIRDLRKAGLETFTCCQSGPGHSFNKPTVRISLKNSKKQIFKALKDLGYDGYTVSQVFCHDGTPYFWDIEFHTNRPKRGIRLTYGKWYPIDELTNVKYELYSLLDSLEEDI